MYPLEQRDSEPPQTENLVQTVFSAKTTFMTLVPGPLSYQTGKYDNTVQVLVFANTLI